MMTGPILPSQLAACLCSGLLLSSDIYSLKLTSIIYENVSLQALTTVPVYNSKNAK